MLEIKDLKARVEEKEILKGLSLSVRPGEVRFGLGCVNTSIRFFGVSRSKTSSTERI